MKGINSLICSPFNRGSTVHFEASGKAVVSAGPTVKQAQTHVVQGGFQTLLQMGLDKSDLNFVDHLNAFVTLGINPSYPNTGYGYIQHDTIEAAPGIFKVKTFTEKPNLELAKTFNIVLRI